MPYLFFLPLNSFQMFVKVFVVMTIAWLFFMLTWIQSRILCYINISTNILQAVLFLYICVLSQKRVTFHLRKTCCYDNCICTCCRPGEPTPETCEWGEEMHYIDTLDNFNWFYRKIDWIEKQAFNVKIY